MITSFNDYDYLLAEGGRSSAKSSSIARFILFLCDTKESLRVVCGREVMERISESVHKLLGDIVKTYNLDFSIYRDSIRHNSNGSEITFKGFKSAEESAVKGLEGIDLLWIDEAQDISEETLEAIVPTIRKENSKILFSMNRFMRNDPVYVRFVNHERCLHITINYCDNPHLTPREVEKAEETKRRSESEYNRVWLGIPYSKADDYLFDSAKLVEAQGIKPSYVYDYPAKIIGIDFAAQGDDSCVACVLEREGVQQWGVSNMISWASKDPADSIGRIVQLLGKEKPEVAVLDVGGMGTIVHSRLIELGVKINRFDGSSTKGLNRDYYNNRAQAYWLTKLMMDDGNLRLPKNGNDLVQELEVTKMKHRSDGRRQLVEKLEIKKTLKRSPDNSDSLAMAVWALNRFFGAAEGNSFDNRGRNVLQRKDGSKRRFAI
jgi:phage terminase large subunit